MYLLLTLQIQTIFQLVTTLATTKETYHSYQELTKMTLPTLSTCRLLIWKVPTPSLLDPRLLYFIIKSLRKFLWNLARKYFLESMLVQDLKPIL